MAEPAIRTSDLGHAYRHGEWLFRGLDLEVPAGSSLAILAPNGRGKSTLLKLLAGSLKPTEGEITRASQVASVPSGLTTEFDYSVFDMVLMGRARQVGLLSLPSRHDEDRGRAALDRFALGAFADRPFNSLSSGERQLVLLARAVASDARILLLDEPTASLDLHNQRLVASWITRLTDEGTTTIYTTHDPNHGMLADQALLMLGDTEWLAGTSSSTIRVDTLERLFGCRVVQANTQTTRAEIFFVVPLR